MRINFADYVKILRYKYEILGKRRLAIAIMLLCAGYPLFSMFGVTLSEYVAVAGLLLGLVPIAYVASRPTMPVEIMKVLSCVSRSGGNGCTFRDVISKAGVEANRIDFIIFHLKELGVITEDLYIDSSGKQLTVFKLWLFREPSHNA